MNKTFIYILSIAAIFALAASCAKEQPDGYTVDKTAVVLEAFGPNPVLRGNTLSFLGQNLDKITSVSLGGDVTVTELADQTSAGFTITVPIETEAGVLTLTYPGGTITTKTELTFTEPFYITKAEAASSLLKPGDIITITGDYLNNIVGMGFASNQEAFTDAKGFQSQTRYKIEAPVARGAVSGKIFIQDGNGNQLYSEETFQVAQPTVATVSPESVRPGDKVTITGTLFTSVDEVTFTGGSSVVAADFDEVTDTKIVVTVPFTVQDGAVSLTTAAGEKIATSNSLTVVMPSELAVSAQDVFKAGHKISITGKNIDLVTGVAFGSESVEFSNDGTTIIADIPAKAMDGVITLTTASGKTVDTEFVTLVKPVITSVSPVSITAGDDITVVGNDLDLVTSVALAGSSLEFDLVSAEEITVHTTATVTSGTIVVQAENGVSAESSAIAVSYDALVNVTSITSPASVGDAVVMDGSNFNLIEAIYFGETKVTAYIERSDIRFEFLIPSDLETGTYNPKFVLFNGDEETCSYAVEVKGAVTVTTIWTGSWNCGNWGGNQDLAWGNYDWSTVRPGSFLRFYLTQDDTAGWWQVELRHGQDWGNLPEHIHVDMTAGQTVVEVEMTKANLDDIIANGGLIITGCNYTLEKVELVVPAPEKQTIWEGSWNCGNWGGNQDLAWGGFDWSSVFPGSTLTFYLTQDDTAGWWQVELRHGQDWGNLPEHIHVDMTAGQTEVMVELSKANLDDIVANGGLIITGCNYTLLKVVLQ